MLGTRLQQYATERQWEVMQAIEEAGGIWKAAKKLNLALGTIGNTKKAVLQKAAKAGYAPEHDLTHSVPDGFKLKGASTLYKDGQPILQWVKSAIDDERQAEIIREMAVAMAEALPRVEPTQVKNATVDNLATVYPIGDAHLGLLAWNQEAGGDYDLAIGERLLTGAIDHLIEVSPACDTAVIAFLGDLFHYDSFEAVTPAHRNLLDADGRFPKMVRVVIRTVRYMIHRALEHHASVHVIIEIGNHDPSSSVFLTECLHNIYENEPRVTIDRSPSHYHYWRFGKSLLGITHGDKCKIDKLPLLMATDRPKDWGETEHRMWFTGHVHHDSVKEIEGVRCESFRVLPPTDAYAQNAGYRAGRDMKAVVFHKEFGEVARYVVNPKMLERAS